jgi:DNA-binding transcriptional LysR family regulator
VPRQLFGDGRSDRSSKLIRGLVTEAAAGFRSRRGLSYDDSAPVTPHNAPFPTYKAVRAAVEAGLGATAISASVAAPSIEADLLYQAAFRLPEREFHVLRRSERYQSRIAVALLTLITNGQRRQRRI